MQIHRPEFTKFELWKAAKCENFSHRLVFVVWCIRLRVNGAKSAVWSRLHSGNGRMSQEHCIIRYSSLCSMHWAISANVYVKFACLQEMCILWMVKIRVPYIFPWRANLLHSLAATLLKLACDFLMMLKTLISMLRFVWLGLELNSAGVGQIWGCLV